MVCVDDGRLHHADGGGIAPKRGVAEGVRHVGSFGDGPTYLFGEATNFWLATTGQGPIHAFNFPSHLLEVQIQDGGRAEVHYRMDSSISSASGVVGTVEGSGTLDVVSDPTLGTSPMEASGENIVLVCLEENPPEQCESFN